MEKWNLNSEKITRAIYKDVACGGKIMKGQNTLHEK